MTNEEGTPEDLYLRPDGTVRLCTDEKPFNCECGLGPYEVAVEHYRPDGAIRCHEILDLDETHPEPYQCGAPATERSIKRDEPKCRWHRGGLDNRPPEFPDLPSLEDDIRFLTECLDYYQGMDVRELDKDEFTRFRALQRDKIAAFDAWRKFEAKIGRGIKGYVEEEAAWLIGKMLMILRGIISNRKVIKDVEDRLDDLIDELAVRPGPQFRKGR